MKISHREIDQAIKDPRAWQKAKLQSEFFQIGYDGYLRIGIYRYHNKNSLLAAERHLLKLFSRAGHRLKDQARKGDVLERLHFYESWYRSSGLIFIQCRVRLSLPFESDNFLTGEISRVDATQSGTQGVLLGNAANDWDTNTQFPLLQLAISNVYNVPLSEISVGVQQLDGSGLSTRSFSEGECKNAYDQLNRFGRFLD